MDKMTEAAEAGDRTAHREREREWAQTEIGRLFHRFEAALGMAWCTDQRESASTASLNRDWGKADAARAEFLRGTSLKRRRDPKSS